MDRYRPGSHGAVRDDFGIEEALSPLASLLDIMDETVIVFDDQGTILAANRAAGERFGFPKPEEGLCEFSGPDVRDIFYTTETIRCTGPDLPFTTDGMLCRALHKTLDGAFEPALVKCRRTAADGPFMLVAYIDWRQELKREQTALLEEMHALDERLQGVLSIVSCVSLGSASFEEIATRIADELQRVMSASVAVIYLADDYGFTPYGMSRGFDAIGMDKTYLPMGVGVPTLVARNRRTTRLQLVSPPLTSGGGAIMLDVDSETRFRLRSLLAECCATLVGTPVFSYDRIVAVVIVGWVVPHSATSADVQLLDTVADYISMEFAAAASQMEQERSSNLITAMNEVRDKVRSEGEMTNELVDWIADRVRDVIPSHVLVAEGNSYNASTFVRLDSQEGPLASEVLEFPHSIDEIFPEGTSFVPIEATSGCGLWMARRTDLSTGYGVLLATEGGRGKTVSSALLVMRGAQDRPFDPVEKGFLQKLAREVGSTLTVEQERAHDAEIAHALQVGLRNKLPETAGLTTASLYISATESAVVGGDFFDLYDLSDDRAVIVLGDVSGKGVEAAAMASLVKTALAAYAWNYLDPASMISSLNTLFLNFSRLGTFASMLVVSIDFQTGEATYCSAGHPPAMLVHRPGMPSAELELLTVQSPVVGAFEGLHYDNGMFVFNKGDILYLYTDGTTEARNADGAFFGEEALRETLLRVCRRGVESVPQGILDEVGAFAGGDLHDDIAMVAVRYDGLEQPSAPRPQPPQEGRPLYECDEDELGEMLDGIAFKEDSALFTD